ncbi:hypothetical protein [Vibrio aerogenes]|nr:hypothetical protein [Vibrio aerogenes]
MSKSLCLLTGLLMACSVNAASEVSSDETAQQRIVTQLVINALNECKWSLKSTERPIAYLDQSKRIIQSNEKAIAQYKKLRDKALAKDQSLVQQQWGDQISGCDTRLPVQLAKYKQQYQLAVHKETIENKSQAYAFGYDKLFVNLLPTLNKVQNGYLKLSDTSDALFKVKPDHTECRFETVIDEHAVYVCLSNFVIALKENKDTKYIQGAPLSGGYYILTGTTNFTTILGGQKQAFTFKQISPLPANHGV